MKYDFDEIIDRRHTGSSKWDNVGPRIGSPDALPMWSADMDFRCPQPIIDAVIRRAQHPVYGYPFVTDDFYTSTIRWMDRRYGWKLEREWLVFATGIIPVFNTMIQALTEKGDKVIISRPVFHNFSAAILDNERVVSNNRLLYRDGRYTIDFDDLRRRAEDPAARMFILCNPHNPIGREWSREDLLEISEICSENNVLLICDEIYADVMLSGNRHTPVGMLGSESMRRNVITCCAPSKAFGCAGLRASAVIVPDPRLRALLNERFKMNRSIQQNDFALPAYAAAYTECDDYLEQLLPYLEKNLAFLRAYLREKMPKIRLVEPDATFLAWLDCSELGLSGDELAHFIIHECGVAVIRGDSFGPEGSSFFRLNIGCPTATLEKGLELIHAQYVKRFE